MRSGFASGLYRPRSSHASNRFAARYLPPLSSAVTRLREDTCYLAGTIGWPAAIWRVTGKAALNTLAALVCIVVITLPQTHLAARAVAGAILAVQVGRLLLVLRRARRDAERNRLAHRLVPAAQTGYPAKATRLKPPAAFPRAVDLGQSGAERQAVQPDH